MSEKEDFLEEDLLLEDENSNDKKTQGCLNISILPWIKSKNL